ncbi:hypothetical protein [Bradyrhizobium cytisi]|uniref:Uncharacterized protein n=1 Tax=Bradyrhizobium cytisi TaxID=515489 RepID=A0A5S4VYD3_9BRAD|nr:hypothetical protein [Bradyrhizobium cytisi]TYL70456.1 hypothetical protein FXB38_41620 [Bradyrhizobium cytisi]
MQIIRASGGVDIAKKPNCSERPALIVHSPAALECRREDHCCRCRRRPRHDLAGEIADRGEDRNDDRRVYEGHVRSRFLCLSQGIRLPTYEEIHPGSSASIEGARKDYSALYQLGAQKGIAIANDTFGSDDDTVPFFCKMLEEQTKKFGQKRP